MTTLNIVDYINSLPENIESIDITYWSITYLPSLKRFHKLKKLDCSNNQLTNLPELNNELREVYCNNNKLTILPRLNNDLKILCCQHNELIIIFELFISNYFFNICSK